MPDSSATLRRISWRDLFPWLILLRTFRIAVSPPLLALATLAVLLAPLGWRLAGLVFQPEVLKRGVPQLPPNAPAAMRSLIAEQQARLQRGAIPSSENSVLAQSIPPAASEYLPAAKTTFLDAYFDFAEPVGRLFQLQTTVREAAYYLCGFLWTLLLWSFPGAMLTRHAVVQLAAESPPGLRETAAFALRRWRHYCLAPLYPLIPVMFAAALIAMIGWAVYLSPGLGSILAGLVWIFVAIGSLAVLWLVAGLLFGFPLMWPTISAERDGDAFEAFSRSFSYVYGKPLHYFFYVVIAALFGALCWAVVESAGAFIVEFGFWALAWGGTARHVVPLRQLAIDFAQGIPRPVETSTPLLIGSTLLGLVVGLIQATVIAFRYSFFFVAASAIYLLLRQDVDEKEMDEVYLENAGPPLAAPPVAQVAAETTAGGPAPAPSNSPA